MLAIIDPRTVINLSIVIGVCLDNTCLFYADQRKIDFQVPHNIDDHFEKIFRINSNVLVGATGQYAHIEKLTSPFVDGEDLDIDTAFTRAVSYIANMKKMFALTGTRTYIIGGKNADGCFGIYTVKYNAETTQIETDKQLIPPNSKLIATRCSLPAGLTLKADEYNDRIAEAVMLATSIQDLNQKISAIICDVADRDQTVNKNISILSIA